jgi:hypothetical protein
MAGINLEAVSYILDKFTTDEIIAYLEKGGYQVIDKSEHGDVLEQLKLARDEISNYEDYNDNEWWQASHETIDCKD